MPSLDRYASAWLRRNFAWSNTRQAWGERLGIILLLLCASGILWISPSLQFSYLTMLWGAWFIVLAATLRRGWLKLFGPVLFYDLVRVSRKSRYAVLRTLYSLLLLFVLFSVYSNSQRAFIPSTRPVTAKEIAAFAQSFFMTFMFVQGFAVAILTPLFTAGAIAEEKERRTLEFILATDLRNREIVLSKLASRLANLTLFILTGLPILSLTQLLGGVDPDLVIVGFAATGLTMMSLAALSILSSVYAKKTRTAVMLTYLLVIAYLGLAFLLLGLSLTFPSFSALPLFFGSDPPRMADLINILNAGNPFYAMGKMEMALTFQSSYVSVILQLFRDYAIFHGVLALICAGWAVARLRIVALKETYGKAQKLPRGFVRKQGRRPPVSDRPMLWKEMYVDRGFQLNWFGRLLMLLLLIISYVPVISIVIFHYPGAFWLLRWDELRNSLMPYLCFINPAVASLAWLGVAVRASSSITGERDRDTWLSLLTSPLEARSILFGKWVGAIWSVRWIWAWMGSFWLLGLISGCLHPLAVLFMIVVWLMFASFVAILGLRFSTVYRTTLRSNVTTLILTILCGAGHWLGWMLCCVPLWFTGNNRNYDWLLNLELYAFTPPSAFVWPFIARYKFPLLNTMNWANSEETGEAFFLSLIGLVFWFFATLFLWRRTIKLFNLRGGRAGGLPPGGLAIPGSTVVPSLETGDAIGSKTNASPL